MNSLLIFALGKKHLKQGVFLFVIRLNESLNISKKCKVNDPLQIINDYLYIPIA